jgi:nucleoid DNA-binding protein
MLAEFAPEELTPDTVAEGTGKLREQQTRREQRELLDRLVDVAGRDGHLSPVMAAQVVAAFFHQMAAEVMQGRCVTIPGIGSFCARSTRPRGRAKARLYVAFTAARNLSVAVCEWGRFDPVHYVRWETYRRNHRPSGRSWRRIAMSPEANIRQAWSQVGRADRRHRYT